MKVRYLYHNKLIYPVNLRRLLPKLPNFGVVGRLLKRFRESLITRICQLKGEVR